MGFSEILNQASAALNPFTALTTQVTQLVPQISKVTALFGEVSGHEDVRTLKDLIGELQLGSVCPATLIQFRDSAHAQQKHLVEMILTLIGQDHPDEGMLHSFSAFMEEGGDAGDARAQVFAKRLNSWMKDQSLSEGIIKKALAAMGMPEKSGTCKKVVVPTATADPSKQPGKNKTSQQPGFPLLGSVLLVVVSLGIVALWYWRRRAWAWLSQDQVSGAGGAAADGPAAGPAFLDHAGAARSQGAATAAAAVAVSALALCALQAAWATRRRRPDAVRLLGQHFQDGRGRHGPADEPGCVSLVRPFHTRGDGAMLA